MYSVSHPDLEETRLLLEWRRFITAHTVVSYCQEQPKKKEEKKKEIKKVPFLCNMSESDSVLSSYCSPHCSPLFKAKARRRDHQEGSVAKIDSISSESPVKN